MRYSWISCKILKTQIFAPLVFGRNVLPVADWTTSLRWMFTVYFVVLDSNQKAGLRWPFVSHCVPYLEYVLHRDVCHIVTNMTVSCVVICAILWYTWLCLVSACLFLPPYTGLTQRLLQKQQPSFDEVIEKLFSEVSGLDNLPNIPDPQVDLKTKTKNNYLNIDYPL